MSLPETNAFNEHSASELGSFYGSVIEDIVAGRDQRIEEKDAAIDRLERENDLLRARIDELSPAIGREAA